MKKANKELLEEYYQKLYGKPEDPPVTEPEKNDNGQQRKKD